MTDVNDQGVSGVVDAWNKMRTAARDSADRIQAALPPGYSAKVTEFGCVEIHNGDWEPSRALEAELAAILPSNYTVFVSSESYEPIQIWCGAWTAKFSSPEQLTQFAQIGFGGRVSGWPEEWPREDEIGVAGSLAAMKRAGYSAYRKSVQSDHDGRTWVYLVPAAEAVAVNRV